MPVNILGREYVSLYELLSFQKRANKNRISVVEWTHNSRKAWTYFSLSELVDYFVSILVMLSVKPSDMVALYLPNSVHMIASYFALWKLGAIAVPINYFWKEDEVAFVLSDIGAKVVITSSEKVVMIEGLRNKVKSLRYVVEVEEVLKQKVPLSKSLADVVKKEHQCAVVIYTSGTTGKPKGAMLSHFNILSNISSCCEAISFSKKDVCPCLLPLFHSFALTVCMLMPISLGAKIVLANPVKIGFKAFLRAMILERATVLVGIPPLFSLMADVKIPKYIPKALLKLFVPLRVCISGSSALSPNVLEKFEKKYDIPLLEGYGLTEASPVVSLNPINDRRSGSVGLPIKDVEIRIVSEDGKECGVGRVGEVLVKGPNVMLGYYRRFWETKNVIKGGWLYTGDLGYRDKDGYLYLVGRKKELIIVRGLNVYPKEIEEVLLKMGGIKEAAVVGVKHPKKGDIPYAFVVLKSGYDFTSREILSYLKAKLADYKIPHKVIILDELPKNNLRKVEKHRLIAMVERGQV